MKARDLVEDGKGSARASPSAALHGANLDAERAAAEALAQRFHETYERLAPAFSYKTREASAVPWAEVPSHNKALMIAVCAEIQPSWTAAAEKPALLDALRLALPILDDDLASFQNDTPPAAYDKRGFVCLDDLLDCEHHRWVECQALLTAMVAIRRVLSADEWADSTYVETQTAAEHFAPTASTASPAERSARPSGNHQTPENPYEG